ncbi:MAG: hypothetical protein LBL01_04945 [Bifidobacteriaceae bacterium]|jgi:hypothetical protein|nr:hypothetical protein [Bifidobacteriaceae bacterium]
MQGLAFSWLAWAAAQPAAAQALASSSSDDGPAYAILVLVLAGPITFIWIRLRYRNTDARHRHESETDVEAVGMQAFDNFQGHRTRTRDAQLPGANGGQLRGSPVTAQLGGLEKAVSQFMRSRES